MYVCRAMLGEISNVRIKAS